MNTKIIISVLIPLLLLSGTVGIACAGDWRRLKNLLLLGDSVYKLKLT